MPLSLITVSDLPIPGGKGKEILLVTPMVIKPEGESDDMINKYTNFGEEVTGCYDDDVSAADCEML